MSNNNKMPEGWGQNKSVPDSWKKANSLPENWGKQSGGNRVPDTFSAADTDQTQESNVSTSELVHTGAGLLTGAAKKISGAAKNAAGSAGAAMADMKDKAASAAAEHKTAGENKAETEYQEVTDYSPSQEGPNRTVEEMIEEVLSASGNDGEGAEYDTVTEEQKVVDNTPINSVSEPLVGQSTVQNERYYEQPVDQPQDQNAGYYEQPVGDQMQLYGYKEKKSPIVYVMAGIIAVLLVGGGILGGMLIMKDKGDKSDRAASSASDVNSKNTDESISAENTSIDDVDEKSTDPDHHSLDDKASSLQKAAESALTDIDAKYGLNSTNKVLFSSDTNYRFYSDDEFSSYADEFEEELKNYFNDVENLNYILEINGGSCIATVVENANGEIGRFPSINNIEDYNMDLFIPKSGGTFKEIADQALANAKKYKKENTTVTEAQTEYVNPYKAEKDKILKSVDNDYYAGKDSHLENAPSDMVFYDIDGQLKEVQITNYTIYDSPSEAGKVINSYMGTNSLRIVGENNDWYYLVEYVGTGRFTHPQYGYFSKASLESGAAKPKISAVTIEEENFFPDGNGSSFYLNTSGDYAFYHYECYYDGQGESNYNCASGDTSESRIHITAGSVFIEIRAVVTPYNNNGTAGDPVSISYKPVGASANIGRIIPCEKLGTIYSPSGNKVDGLTRSYLIDGGSESYERHDLTNGWHIKAVNYYATSISTDAVWYELYDADDGDYYGWVNKRNISFY